jgi:hypothetical protein
LREAISNTARDAPAGRPQALTAHWHRRIGVHAPDRKRRIASSTSSIQARNCSSGKIPRFRQWRLFLALGARDERAATPSFQPSRQVQRSVFHQAEKELTSLPVLRYHSGHRKGRLKILSLDMESKYTPEEFEIKISEWEALMRKLFIRKR